MRHPVLVASTDGVGTKTMVAAALGSYDTLGQDIVNHCINDILVQGAEPLFFLDYVATPTLDPQVIADVVGGVAAACREAGCALLGGETAEMPGVYAPGRARPGRHDRRRGRARRDHRRHAHHARRRAARPALQRPAHQRLFAGAPHLCAASAMASMPTELGRTAGRGAGRAAPLLPAASCAPCATQVDIKGLAHITGGGFVDNIPRILPAGPGRA